MMSLVNTGQAPQIRPWSRASKSTNLPNGALVEPLGMIKKATGSTAIGIPTLPRWRTTCGAVLPGARI